MCQLDGRVEDGCQCLPEPPPPPPCLQPTAFTNREVAPEDWGMTAEQFREFLASCRQTPMWSQKKCGSRYVTLYDLTQLLVKPWTRGTGAGIALRMNPEEPCRATLMVSHTWAEDMDECEEAIVDYCLENTAGLATSIWFCGFAQYQAGDEPDDIGPTIAEQLQLDPFGAVIRNTAPVLGMVVVHTSTAKVYERLWCVYEIAEATRLESKVGIAFSEQYLKQRHTSLVELLKARTDVAQCSNSCDAEMIRTRIQDQGGFRVLDWKIFSFRLESLRAMLAKKDPNWQKMLAEELQHAEEELNKWSVFGRVKSEKKPYSRSHLVMLLAVGILSAALAIAGAAVAAAVRYAASMEEGDGPDGGDVEGHWTTSLQITITHVGITPLPDELPAPPPPPPGSPPFFSTSSQPLAEWPMESMDTDTALLVTVISLLCLGSICMLLVCCIVWRRCRTQPDAGVLRTDEDKVDIEERLQRAKACLCELRDTPSTSRVSL